MRRHDSLNWRVCLIAAVYPEEMGFTLGQSTNYRLGPEIVTTDFFLQSASSAFGVMVSWRLPRSVGVRCSQPVCCRCPSPATCGIFVIGSCGIGYWQMRSKEMNHEAAHIGA